MKQFTQCTNCQQWYVRTYTTAVEIYQSDSLHCTTIWCLRCIDDAERRSQPHDTSGAAVVATPASDPVEAGERPSHVPSSDIFQHFMQEHLQLMDRALYDDETILILEITSRFIRQYFNRQDTDDTLYRRCTAVKQNQNRAAPREQNRNGDKD